MWIQKGQAVNRHQNNDHVSSSFPLPQISPGHLFTPPAPPSVLYSVTIPFIPSISHRYHLCLPPMSPVACVWIAIWAGASTCLSGLPAHAGYQPAPGSELPREPEGTEKSSMSLSLFSRKSCRSRFQLVTRFQLVIKTALQTKLAPILHLTSSKMTWKSLTPILRGRMGMQKVGVKGSPDRRWFCMLLVGQNGQQNYFNGFNAY